MLKKCHGKKNALLGGLGWPVVLFAGHTSKLLPILCNIWTSVSSVHLVVCYGIFPVCYKLNKSCSRNRDLKIRLMSEGRCDERLNARVEESTSLIYTVCFARFLLLLLWIVCFIYYESTKWDLKTNCICECRCYERLHESRKWKVKTRLTSEDYLFIMNQQSES